MTKRTTIKAARFALWVAALAFCCLMAFSFMRAVQTGEKEALASMSRDPETTGSIEPKPMKWCGVAFWCR